MAKLLSVLLLSVLAVSVINAAEQIGFQVKLNINSGLPNPSWTVTDATEVSVLAKALQAYQESTAAQQTVPTGFAQYRGFRVTARGTGGVANSGVPVLVYNAANVEKLLLSSGRLESELQQMVAEEIDKLEKAQLKPNVVVTPSRPLRVRQNCTVELSLPDKGADNFCNWNPIDDHCGYWQSHSNWNNCYNYATDIVSNDWAQPGYASIGEIAPQNLTCDTLKAGAIADGLVFQFATANAALCSFSRSSGKAGDGDVLYSTNTANEDACKSQCCNDGRCGGYNWNKKTKACSLLGRVGAELTNAAMVIGTKTAAKAGVPITNPLVGHYAVLRVNPNRPGYHWIRLDSNTNGVWSHKMSTDAPIQKAADSTLVTNPETADFYPWTTFCGYFLAIPSRINIAGPEPEY